MDCLTSGLRHSCEIGDDMASYGWTEYDGRLGGKQVLSDRGMKVDIETEFIKVPGPNGIPS
jgi:mannosyl-oligosaccharide glucosidase